MDTYVAKPSFGDVLMLYNFSNLSNNSSCPSFFQKLDSYTKRSGKSLSYENNAKYLKICHSLAP